ncbi:hypothetical protein K438DRAFT_1755314 [Mycena galopus ATCC 62051]|nr:hypothetical protein K438DRAFT_1755314 [Mycena galopus ATCC 62051]
MHWFHARLLPLILSTLAASSAMLHRRRNHLDTENTLRQTGPPRLQIFADAVCPLHAFMLDAAVELHVTKMHFLQLTAPTRASLGGFEKFASKYSHSIQRLVIDFGIPTFAFSGGSEKDAKTVQCTASKKAISYWFIRLQVYYGNGPHYHYPIKPRWPSGIDANILSIVER